MAQPIRQTAIASLNTRLTSTIQRLYNSEVAIGLDNSGNFVADLTTNYISSATTVKNAMAILDSKLYSVATTYAPLSYVDTQIANLVDSAPAALSTLFLINEAIASDPQIANTLANQLSLESSRARAAELVLRTDLSGEIVRATGAEAQLRTDLSGEIVRALAAEAQLRTDLSGEIVRSVTMDTMLSTMLNTEIADRTSAISTLTATLTNSINDLSGNLNTLLTDETNRALAAESFLLTAIQSEISRAGTAEGQLRTDISGEIVRALAAELVLRTDLSGEIERAIAAESTLSGRTSTIETTYINKDGSVAFTGNLNMDSFNIINLAAPLSNSDASTKLYVDQQISSLGHVVEYVGTFDPLSQTLADLTRQQAGAYYYVVSTGTVVIGSDNVTLNAGDGIIKNASGSWDKMDNTDPTVAGTSNYIDVAGNADDGYTLTISPSYVGQASITTVGTVTAGTWTADVVGTAYGGTGFSNYAGGDLLVGNNSGSLDKLSVGSNGTVLRSDGVAPSWVVADTEHVAMANTSNFGANSNVQQALDYLFNFTQIRKVAQHVIASSTEYGDSNTANSSLSAGKVNFINYNPSNTTIYLPPSDAGLVNGSVFRIVHNGDFTDGNYTIKYQDKVGGSNVDVLELAPRDSIALVWNEAASSYLFAVGI